MKLLPFLVLLSCFVFTHACTGDESIIPCKMGARKLINRRTQCQCYSGWTGSACDVCNRLPSYCQNNSTFSERLCVCDCGSMQCQNGAKKDQSCRCGCNGFWGGAFCETCTLSQTNRCAGDYDPVTCQCICPTKRCQNGGELNSRCFCSCPGKFKGELCETCPITSVNCTPSNEFLPEKCACVSLPTSGSTKTIIDIWGSIVGVSALSLILASFV